MGMDNRFVRLHELKPDSNYYFVVRDSDGVSPRMWFRTAPDKPKPFTIVAGGDTKSKPKARKRGRRGNRMVAKLRPLFVVYAGDFTSGAGTDPAGWQNWLDDWSRDTIADDGRVFPIVPVRGNHESNPNILYRLFGLPDPENYFAFTVGGDMLRVYTLNSQLKPVDEQRRWLIDDLKRHGNVRWKLASYHKPLRPHTARKPENDYMYDAFARPFYDYRVNLAVEGDSHMHKITYPLRPSVLPEAHQGFVRDDKRGTMFVGEGSWGANVRANDDDKPWTLASGSVTQVKWIHVYADQITIRSVLTENVAAVEPLDEKNVFVEPVNLRLFDNKPHGTVICYPFIDSTNKNVPEAEE